MGLAVCSECARHVRDATCPFCGAEVARSAEPSVAGRVARVLVAAGVASAIGACGLANGYGGPPPGDPANPLPPVDGGATD